MWEQFEKLSEVDKMELDRKFTVDEIKNVVNTMATNRAPGPNVFIVEFFKKCLPIILDDLVDLFEDFYMRDLNMSRINFGVIILFLKSTDVDTI